MSNAAPPLCMQCNAQLAHNVNRYGRGLCAACFERFLELEGTAPPQDREDIYGRLAAWRAPPERVTVCWHIAPGEDWSKKRWRGYLVEWVAVTPFWPVVLHTEPERCEQSGKLRQIIRWRLWKAGVPGFVERFLAGDFTWETITRKTGDEEHASALRELMGTPRRGPQRGRSAVAPEEFKARSDAAYASFRAEFRREPTHTEVAKRFPYSPRHWERRAKQLRYEPPPSPTEIMSH
jgi:hypothetical protein